MEEMEIPERCKACYIAKSCDGERPECKVWGGPFIPRLSVSLTRHDLDLLRNPFQFV